MKLKRFKKRLKSFVKNNLSAIILFPVIIAGLMYTRTNPKERAREKREFELQLKKGLFKFYNYWKKLKKIEPSSPTEEKETFVLFFSEIEDNLSPYIGSTAFFKKEKGLNSLVADYLKKKHNNEG